MEATDPYAIKNQRRARNHRLDHFIEKARWMPELVLYGIRELTSSGILQARGIMNSGCISIGNSADSHM